MWVGYTDLIVLVSVWQIVSNEFYIFMSVKWIPQEIRAETSRLEPERTMIYCYYQGMLLQFQCCQLIKWKIRNYPSVRFYVKSILEDLKWQKLQSWPFQKLWIFILVNLCKNFRAEITNLQIFLPVNFTWNRFLSF